MKKIVPDRQPFKKCVAVVLNRIKVDVVFQNVLDIGLQLW